MLRAALLRIRQSIHAKVVVFRGNETQHHHQKIRMYIPSWIHSPLRPRTSSPPDCVRLPCSCSTYADRRRRKLISTQTRPRSRAFPEQRGNLPRRWVKSEENIWRATSDTHRHGKARAAIRLRTSTKTTNSLRTHSMDSILRAHCVESTSGQKEPPQSPPLPPPLGRTHPDFGIHSSNRATAETDCQSAPSARIWNPRWRRKPPPAFPPTARNTPFFLPSCTSLLTMYSRSTAS